MLTAVQVKSELDSLIEKYPTATGSVMEDGLGEEYGDEATCVYYMDASNNPVNLSTHYDDGEATKDVSEDARLLVTPVCIVGHWIEELHPELKQNDVILKLLLRNGTIRSLRYLQTDELPFSWEVMDVLEKYQTTQDSSNVKTWGEIPDNIDKVW